MSELAMLLIDADCRADTAVISQVTLLNTYCWTQGGHFPEGACRGSGSGGGAGSAGRAGPLQPGHLPTGAGLQGPLGAALYPCCPQPPRCHGGNPS